MLWPMLWPATSEPGDLFYGGDDECRGFTQAALAANVKVTPLGTHDGEFCPQDRAMVFEDPNGTRILYDPGRTVAGPGDPRLGKIDIILVSHASQTSVGLDLTRALHKVAPRQPILLATSSTIDLGVEAFFGDGWPASAAWVNRPFGIAFDTLNRLVVADSTNHRVRRVGLVSARGVCMSPPISDRDERLALAV